VIHAEIKVMQDSIGMHKNDIWRRKRQNKITARLKDDDDGNVGNKIRERNTTSTIEKIQANLSSRAHHTLLKWKQQK
jgi:hypothetical protein